jgi:hypothetical protein
MESNDKEGYYERMRSLIRAWELQMNSTGGEVSGDLKQKKEEYMKKLEQMKNSSGDRWKELREDVDRRWEELRDSAAEMIQR